MAIAKSATTLGIDLTNAYHKVVAMSFTETGVTEEGVKEYQIDILVRSYTDDTKEFQFNEEGYSFSLAGKCTDDPCTIAYTLLKTLPDFDGAVDC